MAPKRDTFFVYSPSDFRQTCSFSAYGFEPLTVRKHCCLYLFFKCVRSGGLEPRSQTLRHLGLFCTVSTTGTEATCLSEEIEFATSKTSYRYISYAYLAEPGLEPGSKGYEPFKETTPPLRSEFVSSGRENRTPNPSLTKRLLYLIELFRNVVPADGLEPTKPVMAGDLQSPGIAAIRS